MYAVQILACTSYAVSFVGSIALAMSVAGDRCVVVAAIGVEVVVAAALPDPLLEPGSQPRSVRAREGDGDLDRGFAASRDRAVMLTSVIGLESS